MSEQGLIKPQRLHRTHPVTARCQQLLTPSEHRLLTVWLRGSFEVALPNAGQVADPFGVTRLANNSINEVRRRSETTRSVIVAANTTPSTESGAC